MRRILRNDFVIFEQRSALTFGITTVVLRMQLHNTHSYRFVCIATYVHLCLATLAPCLAVDDMVRLHIRRLSIEVEQLQTTLKILRAPALVSEQRESDFEQCCPGEDEFRGVDHGAGTLADVSDFAHLHTTNMQIVPTYNRRS